MNLRQEFLVRESFSLREALRSLSKAGQGVLLLVDDAGRLRRTVTDGDIRRLLLQGYSLDATLAELPPREPKTVRQGDDEARAMELMNEFEIDHIPVLDERHKPVALLLRRELDSPILLSTPHLSVHERAFVEEAFVSNWITPLGPNVDAFERELAAYVGSAHGAAVSSGTAAIHLALRVLGVTAGDTVFCSSLTFVASANPILYLGATPVFIDSEPDSWNMSPAALSRALDEAGRAGQLPRVVIVVNLYGQSADYDPILELCNRYGVSVVEDAAESLGATYRGRMSGTLGRIGTYSFNGNKIITTSGGGMLVSKKRELIEKARFLSAQARESCSHYEHLELGYNYRLSNILASIGLGQLKVLEDRVAARRAVFGRYRDALRHIPEIQWMPESSCGRSTHWLSACTLHARSPLGATDLIGALARERIEARPLWKPMHLQPLYKNCKYYPHIPEFSVSDDLFRRGLCLPSGSNMQAEQQTRIIEAIDRAFAGVSTAARVGHA